MPHTNVKSISVLGCGWLGLPLARELVSRGYRVRGSTTSREKIPVLKEAGIEPYLINVLPALDGEGLEEFFAADILFLNIPFRRSLEDPSFYKRQIDSVVSRLEASSISFVIFAGSTSIYPPMTRDTFEDEPFDPEHPRAKVLWQVEQSLLNHKRFEATVVRFAGMYGAGRKIGQLLAGRKGLDNAESPVNLIHLDDCLGVSLGVIEGDVRGEIFNAVSDKHPIRKEVYTKAALHYGLTPPEFTSAMATRLKVVSNAKVKEKLNYTFKHPDPLEFSGE